MKVHTAIHDGTEVRFAEYDTDAVHVETRNGDGFWESRGYYYATPSGIFAEPNRCQIATIPCRDWQDAASTVLKLGRMPSSR